MTCRMKFAVVLVTIVLVGCVSQERYDAALKNAQQSDAEVRRLTQSVRAGCSIAMPWAWGSLCICTYAGAT